MAFNPKSKKFEPFQKKIITIEQLQNIQHEIVFAIQPKNQQQLEQLLFEVSNPDHEKYGQYLSHEEVIAITKNEEGNQLVKEYLSSIGATVLTETNQGEFITAVAPLSLWKTHLQTEFYQFVHPVHGIVYRSEGEYFLPPQIKPHILGVFNVNDLPVEIFSGPVIYPIDEVPVTPPVEGQPAYGTGQITPSVLNKYYGIYPNLGNNKTTQGVFESNGQILSLSDLTLFQQTYKLPLQQPSRFIGGAYSTGACSGDPSTCSEANLDFQYIMAIGQKVQTTLLYYTFNGWLPIIQNLTSWNNPPKVISMSYGSYETSMSPGYIQAWNNAAVKLGVMGTTLVVSSGDDGVSGYLYRTSGVCMYGPMFPASSPYVLSVGGTMGPEVNATEVVCQSNLGGTITSGGGFSFYTAAPSYQQVGVAKYVAANPNLLPGFNGKGRGYPDISAAAASYITVIGGTQYVVAGTSAAAPVVAGQLSLINAQRAAQKLPSLGFFNPYLYTNYLKLTRDVTKGNNSCGIVGYPCCAQGFPAAVGWDPATGLGSLNFSALYHLAVPQKSPTASTVRNTDPSGEAAGTVFFVLAFVFLFGLWVFSLLTHKHDRRKESFTPLRTHPDEDDTQL